VLTWFSKLYALILTTEAQTADNRFSELGQKSEAKKTVKTERRSSILHKTCSGFP
jgi:hypothetical protein